MNTSMNMQQLRGMLVGLCVRSPELAGKAEDWLKPILADSAIYQNLASKAASAKEQYKEKARNALILIVILIILALTHRYWKNLEFGTQVLCLAAPVLASLVILVEWINQSFEYRGAARERARFVKQWVDKVAAAPGSVERLARFFQAVQDLESIQQGKGVKAFYINRDQLVDYLLTAGDDAARVLPDYLRAVEASKFEGTVKHYLLSNAFFYALIYLYSPGGFQKFMEACYATYLYNPSSFDTPLIEKIFDVTILKTQGV